MAGRLRCRVPLCAVYIVYVETRSAGFWLSLKTKVDGLSVVWPQNHWDGFLWFGLKTGGDGFSRFGLKIGGSGFPVWVSKPTTAV
jgi:hypothetical protein